MNYPLIVFEGPFRAAVMGFWEKVYQAMLPPSPMCLIGTFIPSFFPSIIGFFFSDSLSYLYL